MCGRYSLSQEDTRFRQRLRYPEQLKLQARYNIAPTQDAPVVIDDGGLHLRLMRWGLVPFWAKDRALASSLINARAETLPAKPAFRRAYQRRRCLVLADGFYEWSKDGASKQPFRITLAEGEPFAFAGIWESWSGGDGSELETFCIITTQANALLASLHHRMPVILPESEYEAWLDPKLPGAERAALLRPYVAESMKAFRVSRAVNDVKNDHPGCAAPLNGDQGASARMSNPGHLPSGPSDQGAPSSLAPLIQSQLRFDAPL